MRNAERVMNDVAIIVRDFELGRLNATDAVYEVLDLVNDDCRHCAFSSSNCRDDHQKTCGGGFEEWLGEEA